MNDKTRKIMLAVAVIAIAAGIYFFEGLNAEPAGAESISDPVGIAPDEAETSEPASLKDGKYPRSPELAGITGYINAEEGVKIRDFQGKVVLVDFWTYTCINCLRTLPYLTSWDEKYRDKGLVIIGVHTPEFNFEKKKENVEAAMEKYGVKYRVVQDNDYATWRAFGNRYWPRKYLIDKDGYIRYDHIGEGAYAETEEMIKKLLAETGEDVDDMKVDRAYDVRPAGKITPELYAGYRFNLPRGQDIGNEGGLKAGAIFEYYAGMDLKKDVIYLEGVWKSNEDDMEAAGDAAVILDFTASSVNIVVDYGDMEVFVDGAKASAEQAGNDADGGTVKFDVPRLYNVFEGGYGNHVLRLDVSKGFRFNAFTFG